MKRSFLTTIQVVLIMFLAACSKNAENEHLPEYCQTYAGFTATASRDMFELLDDAGYAVNRFNYLSVISEIELEFELDDPNRTVDLGGIQCFQNLTSLSLSGRSFKDISDISALSNIQAIQLRNTSIVSIDSFKNLSKINHLVISETKTLQNVEGVGEMTKLTTLDLSNNGLVNIGELNALVNLQHLYLDHNEIIYFPSINNLEQLETLDISHNNIIQLGDDLSGLRNLEELNASNNQICDISTLDDLESVEILDLSYNDLGCNGVGISPNFDSLENAINLRELKLNNNGLTSIEGLRDRDISLEVLHLHNNELSDITPIAAYTDITELVLYNNNITTLNDLSGMTGLTTINVSKNNISNLTDLMLITTLTHINLSENNISTIPDISGEWPNLSVLDLHSNPLVDVSGVEGHPSLETLILYNSGLTVLEGISNLPELDTLVIVDAELEAELDPDDQNPNVISTLINSFNNNPSLPIQTDFILDLGFEFGPDVEIYNSIQGNVSVGAISWAGMDIRIIDETSIQLPNLVAIDVSNNNLSDIRFILGNPDLEMLYLSGNAISNISVINGTNTSDLDNLTLVEINNNAIGSSLQNAFIDLPRIEEISLLGTPIISIDNSFNNLSSLITMDINGQFIQSITDSFNNLFSQYRSTNQFIFDGGNLTTIDNSFNGGQYNIITITNQSPIIGSSTIISSFNDLNIVGDEGIRISDNEFSTITDSFLRIITDVLDLADNQIQSITGSFTDSEIELLQLVNNELTTLVGVNTASSITNLNLDNNRLTTLSFVDSIPDLEVLSFQTQEIGFGIDTLLTLDGINNQPNITTLNGDLSGITEITGLQNTGITNLDLSVLEMGVSGSISIGADAFTGTPLVSLNLSGHALSNLTFLANLTIIEQLNIGLNVTDLSDFIGLPMELTLEELTFTNISPISDFVALSGYDTVDTLTLPSNTIHINNLDGMDALQSITLNQDNILTISDSYNNLPSFEPNEVYLELFTNLTTITRSFDLYGSNNNSIDFVTISGDYAIIDSFRNVAHITIENNAGDTDPTFDSDSFTVVESIFFETASYSSYLFLSNYSSLTSLTIGDLDSNITDLSNTTLDIVSISSNSVTLASVSVTMADTGTFLFTSLAASNFDITVNTSDITIEADNGNVTLNTTNSAITLSGESNGFILNATNLTSLSLGNFSALNSVYNTPLLASIIRTVTTVINATTLDINSNVAALDYNISATSLHLYNSSLSSLILVNDGDETTIHDGQSNLTIDATVDVLLIDTDTVTSVTLTGTVNDITVDSTLLTTLDVGAVTISTITVVSNQAALTVNGSDVESVSITNNVLTNLSAGVNGADVDLISSNTSLVITDSSVIGALDLTAMTELNSIDYGLATVSSIDMVSSSTSMSVTGTAATSITYTTTTLDTLLIDISASNMILSDSASSLTIDGSIDSLQLDGSALDTLVLSPGSSITTLTISSGDTLSFVNANDSTVAALNITTGDTTLTLNGTNINSTTITGLSLTSANIDVGTNDVILTTGTASLLLTGTANSINLTSQTDDLTIADSSSLSFVTVTAPNMSSISTGTALISTISLTDTSSSLTVTGSGITSMTIDAAVDNVIATLAPSTILTITSSSSNVLVITTSTTDIDVTASVDTTINGNVLETVTASLGSNSLTLDLDQANLAATIAGSAGELTITGNDVTGLTFTPESSFDSVDLTNLNVTTLDTTGSTILELQLTTSVTTFTLIAPTSTTIGINGSNLDTLSITALGADVTVFTNQNTLVLSGTSDVLTVTGSNMTSLTVTGFTVNQMNLVVDSMTTLDTVDSIQTSLTIETDQATFDLTTNAPTVGFTSSVDSDLNMTSTTVGTIDLTTSSSTIDLNAPSTTVLLTGNNIASITGTVGTLNASGFTTFVLSLDLIGTDIQIADAGTMLSVTASGAMSNLSINGASISSFVTTGLSVSGTLTIENTSLTNLSFISPTLLGSVTTIDFSELDTSDISSIITTLNGTTITLISSLTESDIYDYYYAEELASLTAQEGIDQAYYDSIRSAAVDASWIEILANVYMDHLDETTTKAAIDSDTLGNEDFYFNSYLSDAGLTVDDLANGEEALIRSTITTTLNQVASFMNESTLQADTTAAIEADANTVAQTETNAITFTIG